MPSPHCCLPSVVAVIFTSFLSFPHSWFLHLPLSHFPKHFIPLEKKSEAPSGCQFKIEEIPDIPDIACYIRSNFLLTLSHLHHPSFKFCNSFVLFLFEQMYTFFPFREETRKLWGSADQLGNGSQFTKWSLHNFPLHQFRSSN